MAAMQSLLNNKPLTEVTLRSWQTFITKLAFRDIGPYIGSTSAAFVSAWPSFDLACRRIACDTLDYLILQNADNLQDFLPDIVSLDGIPDLKASSNKLKSLRHKWTVSVHLEMLMKRANSENLTVMVRSLGELKQFMATQSEFMQKLASGDVFDSSIGPIIQLLLRAASRDGEAFEEVRLLAFECIGQLGALDPDRFEIVSESATMSVLHNLDDESEAVSFALHLIQDLLVGSFRSTSDLRYQSHLAFAIQELLKFCGFTSDLVKTVGSHAVPMKIRARWESLPTHILDTIAPLLDGKFSLGPGPAPEVHHPIYNHTTSYREWIQTWSSHLILRASSPQAKRVFGPFRLAIRNQDVEVPRHLLPHLVLHILISGEDEDHTNIRSEIIVVLKDQVNATLGASSDKRLLTAQVMNLTLDYWPHLILFTS